MSGVRRRATKVDEHEGLDGPPISADDLRRYRENRQRERGGILPQGEAAVFFFYYVFIFGAGLGIFYYLFIHLQLFGLWPP
mmetsp:Transcript_31118/g.81667  ORF Transcript_31118/g.81667 Transcript_31118/m.81667 type:complete len:81 (+) Transcript_31118:83-325(+)